MTRPGRAVAMDAMAAFRHALSTVTSPMGDVTRWTRDGRGHLLTHTLPMGSSEVRTYDAATGYLDTVTRPYGTLLDFTTDAAGRVTTRTGSDGSLRSFTYGSGDRIDTLTDATGTTEYQYDPAGRWTGVSHASGSTWSRDFDVLDRITSVTVHASATGPARSTVYTHDAAGNIATVTDPLGGVTTMEHDLDGRLTFAYLAQRRHLHVDV